MFKLKLLIAFLTRILISLRKINISEGEVRKLINKVNKSDLNFFTVVSSDAVH